MIKIMMMRRRRRMTMMMKFYLLTGISIKWERQIFSYTVSYS